MMKYLLKIIFTIILSIILINIYGQSPRFDSYKVLKNKKNVDVSDIFQDQKGYIWLATNYGLVKFDGVDFQLFTTEDSLYDNNISCINEDPEGILWIGHKSGKISYYNGNKFKKFNPEEGLSAVEISSFFIDHSGVLWFSTYGEGVYYYAGEIRKRLYNLNTDNGLLDNYVYALVQDADSNLYLATDKGISVYDIENKTFNNKITMSDGLPDNIVKDMIIKDSDLWIAMEDGGICKYNLNTKKFSILSDWEFGSINDFVLNSENEIWVSTKRNGVIKINYDNGNVTFSVYGKNNDLPEIRTRTIFKDREKNIWIGTRNGLSVRKNNNFEFLNEKDGFTIKDIFSFVIDDLGNYWVASQQGLYIVKKSKAGEIQQKLLFHEPKNAYSFISLYKDHSGNIWAGTYGYGVFKIDPFTLEITQYNSKNGLSNDNIIHISGNKDNIWLSTLGGGITKYCANEKDKFRNYTTNDGLTSDYVYSTFTDSKNRTWIATDGGGVVYFRNDSILSFSNPKLDSIKKTVYSVIEDRNSNIWFNCADDGLYQYDGNQFYHYHEGNGLRTNFIQGLSVDLMGNPVIISNEGVDKYIIKDSIFEYYGEIAGVSYQEPHLNSVYKDKQGNIWIGTASGMIKLNSNISDTTEILPKIFISRKSIFFNPIKDHKKNTFRYNENHLSFSYTGLWFKSSENLMYRHKLEGYDIDWSIPTKLRTVTYSNLPPGDYKFIVQVNYSGGKWISSPDSEFSFTIKKPFWKTYWFIATFIILVLIGIYVFIKARLKKLQRDKEILEEEVRKRTLEIMNQKEEIESQRDELETQRNYLIKQNDKIEKQNKNITSSIEYASRIQQALLPPKENFTRYLGEHFIFFRPRDIVSGDFYYLNVKDDNVIVAAADCTGHGVPGAFMSILGISLLDQITNQVNKSFTAGEILTLLREEIKHALRQTGKANEANDGMDISLCVLNRKKSIINYAGAYNPLILIRDNKIVKYKADKMPIGIYIREKEVFTNHVVEIRKGDSLYIYSDGFQDQFGGEENKKFLPKNLNNLLLEISGHPAQKQKEILNEKLDNWKGDNPQVDDIIILGFKI